MIEPGTRVEFVGFGEPDPYSDLAPGTAGTVSMVDSAGTLHVDWDSGHHLGLCVQPPPWHPAGAPFKPDRYRVLEDEL